MTINGTRIPAAIAPPFELLSGASVAFGVLDFVGVRLGVGLEVGETTTSVVELVTDPIIDVTVTESA